MTTKITRKWRCSHRENYHLTYHNHKIDITITHTPRHFLNWINRIIHNVQCNQCHSCGKLQLRRRLIVSLGISWRRLESRRRHDDDPVAILQLCVGNECLIFQLHYAKEIPKCLANFLRSDDFVFVGIGIEDDALKLMLDYDLQVVNTIDLHDLATWRMGRYEVGHVGLTSLAREVLGIHYEKPKKISMSEWDKPFLSKSQVQYASLDAFLSFSIAHFLCT